MKGPTPKNPATRRRTNRVSTARTLAPAPAAKVPALPAGREWNELTLAWWRDVWASPMVSEFLDADAHGLLLLADLIDRYWREPSQSLAAEIRQHRQEFGLTPIARRRLQWEVARAEDATARKRPAKRRKDPRVGLEASS